MSEIRFTPDGFKSVVRMCLTGEFGEHIEPRRGSLLELAYHVANRCMAVCHERGVAMDDDVYDEVVAELAPQFREKP